MPLALLDLDIERLELLARWGLRTIGDLARAAGHRAWPSASAPTVRACGASRAARTTGLFVPAAAPDTFEMTLELDWPVDGLEPLSFLLARVLEPLCAGLVARGRRAAALTLDLGLVDRSIHRRVLKPAAPSAEPRTWRTLLLLDLEAHPPRDAIQAITVRAEPTPSRPCAVLAPRPGAALARAAGGDDGASSCVDRRRPRRRGFAPRHASAGRLRGGDVRPRAGRRERAPPPGPPRVALRAFRPPLPADVAAARAARRPSWPRRGSAARWSSTPAPGAPPGDWWDVAWSREEWDVALRRAPGDSGVYRIFRDRLREAWFVEGELD